MLGETHGLVVYQEQVMAIAQRVVGYSLASADLLRRAIESEKAELEQQYEAFLPTRHEPESASFSQGEASQGPCGTPCCRSSGLRIQQEPTGRVCPSFQYWTELPQGELPRRVHGRAAHQATRDDKDRSAVYLNECRRMGIKVLPPDVNESETRSHLWAPTSGSGCIGHPQRRRQRRRGASQPCWTSPTAR